jgi:hypothetical protein
VYKEISICLIGGAVCGRPSRHHCFLWCVMKVVIFNTCFGSIIWYMVKLYFEDFSNCHFELFEEHCMEIITIGQIFLSNYNLLRFKK